MTKQIEPINRPPLIYHSVQNAIRNYIIENQLRAGDPLPPENELARSLGVSRNSVREAARSLESLGVIETRRGSGLFVQDFSFDPILDNLQYSLLFDLRQLSDLTEVRRVLEIGMIETAMQIMPLSQKEQLQDIVKKMRKRAEAGETFPTEDREFHQLLFENVGNSVLTKLLDIFWQTFNKASAYIALADNNPMWTYQAHKAIVDAIMKDDVEGTRRALDEHYAGLEGRIQRAHQNKDEL